MILLAENHYESLDSLLDGITINTYFARSVVQRKVKGAIFVNDIENPSTFYIRHPYGMGLLFGNPNDDSFNSWFVEYALNRSGQRHQDEWVQAYPGSWNEALKILLGSHFTLQELATDKILCNTRVNFRFHEDKYRRFREDLLHRADVVRMNEPMFSAMKGSVIPSRFWNSAEEFMENAVGYSLLVDGKVACTAFSAFLFPKALELGMETLPEYRGKGYALLTCARLIDYCLENHREPIWACRLENSASYQLAQRLGFEPEITLPYYRLCK